MSSSKATFMGVFPHLRHVTEVTEVSPIVNAGPDDVVIEQNDPAIDLQ